MSEQVGITINKEQQITYTKKEQSYIISSRDWKRLTKSINRLRNYVDIWSNVASGALGIGSSCILSWVTGYKAIWLLVIGCTALGISVCSFVGMLYAKTQNSGSIDNLKEVVQDIEDAIISKDL